jgi:folate-binding protein YgfZ
MAQCAPGKALYAGLLTPQGKLLFDFFVIDAGPETFLIDCYAPAALELGKRLSRYRLRAKVAVTNSDLAVAALWSGDAPVSADAIVVPDPRLPELGRRAYATPEVLLPLGNTNAGAYHAYRLSLGVPDSADLPPEQIFPLDAGFEELNGVSFRKGCYVGQEVTARMKHRATARRRVAIAEFTEPLPAGAPIEADGREIGTLASGNATQALAHVRVDRLAEAEEKRTPLRASGREIRLRLPDWVRV